MKHNIFLAAVGSTLLFLGACSEGQYWDEPGDFGSNPAFPKASQTIVLGPNDEVPPTMNVTLSRADASEAMTVGVEATPANDASALVLSGPSEVSFEAGSYTAEYPISIDKTNMSLGANYTLTLQLTQPEDALVQRPAGNMKYTFSLKQDYDWQSAGVAKCISYWVGNESPINVQVQEAGGFAGEGQRLFRLVSPYFVMEPDYAVEGYNLQFLTTTSGEAVALTPTWQQIGEGDDTQWFYIGTGYNDCYFGSEGDIYTIVGLMGYTEGPSGTSLKPYTYETFIFQWTCPAQ